ncbi:hypothetical protein E4U41_007270 [Claviceps citrina]|nr:hypothetical protein E4U41_007270 [Claviceps citrina]
MSSSFEKSVKGATKIKNAPPKTKYIEHILIATHSGDAGVAEVFRSLQYRLHDSTWTVVLKSLLTTHLMIREGSPDVTLAFLSKHRSVFSVGHFADAQTQGRNIRHYANYLSERARAYRDTKTDWVRTNEARLERLTVEKGLLRETEVVQNQLSALVKCDVLDNEPENEITIAIFRLLVLDLLALFQVLNQGLINILGHFFEMSKTDAERALDIYRNFTRQTDHVVQYLSSARLHEHHTRVEVPKLKHAPVNLGRQLEEYLKDADFEIHRRQYLAEQDAKKKKAGARAVKVESPKSTTKPSSSSTANSNNPFPSVPVSGAKNEATPKANKGPDPDLIDFFDSIEQNQTTIQVNSPPTQMPGGGAGPFQPQQTGMPFPPNGLAQQQTGFVPHDVLQQQSIGGFISPPPPPQQLQPNFTGAGYGGFTPAFQPGALGSVPQGSEALFQDQNQAFQYSQQQQQQQQQQSPQSPSQMQMAQPNPLLPAPTGTNPFRQSMMMQQTGRQATSPPHSPPPPAQHLNRQSTNPFARSSPQTSGSFPSPPPLQTQPTGTNPFAKNTVQQQQTGQSLEQQQQQAPYPASLAPQPTGTTNPFRQGAFVNHSTGMGWQHNQGTIGGGLDQLPTVPVFPRPAQQTPWQQ